MALGLYKQHKELTQFATNRQRQIDKLDEDRKKSEATVNLIKKAAGVDDVDELRAAIDKSDRLRELTEELAGVEKALDEHGDGLASRDS